MDDIVLPEELRAKYRLVASPADLGELRRVYGVPTFQDDPKVAGKVIVDRRWYNDNIVLEWFPCLGQVHVHKYLVIPLWLALAKIDSGPDSGYIKAIQSGTWVPRRNFWKPGARLSTHALGLSLDVNWNENPVGGSKDQVTILKHPGVISAFKEQGFEFGGDWKTPDWMHFQRLPSSILLPK